MTSKQLERWSALILFFFVLGLAQGCATNIRRASGPPQPPPVSQARAVPLEPVELTPAPAPQPQRKRRKAKPKPQTMGTLQPTVHSALEDMSHAEGAPGAKRARGAGARVSLTARDAARQAMIFHEIFSPPKALRTGKEMWDG